MFGESPQITKSESSLQDMINVLEAVKHYKRSIEFSKNRSLEMEDILNDFFPTKENVLTKQREHDIEIYKMCIKRLVSRYNKLNKEFSL